MSAETKAALVAALRYWLPDETWMDEHFPRADPVCKVHWDKFYEACALLRDLGESS